MWKRRLRHVCLFSIVLTFHLHLWPSFSSVAAANRRGRESARGVADQARVVHKSESINSHHPIASPGCEHFKSLIIVATHTLNNFSGLSIIEIVTWLSKNVSARCLNIYFHAIFCCASSTHLRGARLHQSPQRAFRAQRVAATRRRAAVRGLSRPGGRPEARAVRWQSIIVSKRGKIFAMIVHL